MLSHSSPALFSPRWISNPFTEGSKFNLSDPFQKQAAAFGMDWLQFMAQGFQESSLNHKSKSPYGAVGITLFVLGLLSPLFIPLVTATALPAGWKTALSGLLMLGIPELLWAAAAAIMGKAGFNYIKGKFWGGVKKIASTDHVSSVRYRFGLVMFSLPILFGWLAPYGTNRIPGYETHHLAVNVMGDVLLFSSLFVLGGDFWDKLRGLFIHKAKIKISSRESE